MTPARPFTPDQLADRWQCSAETIRQMVRRGELRAFRTGRMIRIPRDAVMEHEECQSSQSDDSKGDSVPSGAIPRPADAGAIVLRQAQQRKPAQKP